MEKDPEHVPEHVPEKDSKHSTSHKCDEPKNSSPNKNFRHMAITLKNFSLQFNNDGTATYIDKKSCNITSNGISATFTPKGKYHAIRKGQRLRVCTRPVIPRPADSNDPPETRVHFTQWHTGHASDCACGSCGYRFWIDTEPPKPCDCGTEPWSVGEQPCCIQ